MLDVVKKIFIYADGLDEKLQFGLDYGNTLHRKIHIQYSYQLQWEEWPDGKDEILNSHNSGFQ